MDGEKMDNLKEAVGYVVDRLAENDRLSVTIFDDTVETLVPSQPVQDRSRIKSAVGSVIARGGTQIADGLRAGLEQVRSAAAPDRVNRVLLLTDGQTWDDETACLGLADEASRDGIAVTSIGIGDDWNEKLLLQIAERSRGNSHWIQNPIAILDAFRQEVEGMRSVAMTDVRISVHPEAGMRVARIHRTVPMIAEIATPSAGGVVPLGALDGSRGQMLLFELRIAARQPGTLRLGRIDVTYDIPSQGVKDRRVSTELSVTLAQNAAEAGRVNAEVMNLVERISAFKLQTRALRDVAAGDLDAATRRLQSAATVLLDLGERELAAAATAEANKLASTGALTAAGTKKLEYGTRKLTQVLTKAIRS